MRPGKGADEDVDEVKRLLTDVGALEFRILASRKKDSSAIERALCISLASANRTPISGTVA